MDTARDDRTLLKAWISDADEAAFQILVGRYAGLVHATCRRVAGEGPLAEDAAQATFLLLWRKAAGISAEVILAGWLHTVARHAALKAVRTEARRRHHERQAREGWTGMGSQTPDPRWAEMAPMLDEALADLGLAEREAVVLRFLAGKSWEELAAILGVQRNTAEKRVGRALDRLRERFSRRGVQVTSAALAAILLSAPVEAATPTFDLAQATPAAERLAVETARAFSRRAWPWLTGVAAILLVSGLSWFLAQPTSPAPAPAPAPVPGDPPPPSADPIPADGQRLVIQSGHTSSNAMMTRVCGSRDGRFIGSCDMVQGELRIWDGERPDRVLFAAEMNASAIAFAPDGGSFAVLSFRGPEAISLWSWPAGRLLRRLPSEGCHVNEAVISYLADGRRLLANHAKGATIHDLVAGGTIPVQPLDPVEQKRLTEIIQELEALRAARTGVTRVMGDLLGRSRSKLDELRRLEAERDRLVGGAFGNWQVAPVLGGAGIAVLLNAYDRARPPSLCDAETGGWLRNCEDRHPVTASYEHQTQATLTASIDGAWIAVRRLFQRPDGSRAASMTVWDAATGAELAHLDRPDLSLVPILLPDRSAVLVLSGGIVKRWNWGAGTAVEDLAGAGSEKTYALAALDGSCRRIALLGSGARILELASGTSSRWAWGGGNEGCDAASLAVGPGGRLVAVAAGNGHVAVWDLAEARQQAHTRFGKPSAGGSEWTHLAFAPDARSLHLLQAASAYENSEVRLGRWILTRDVPEELWNGILKHGRPYNGLAVNGHWAAMVDGGRVRRFALPVGAEMPPIPVPDPGSGQPPQGTLTLGRDLSESGTIQIRADLSEQVRVVDLAQGGLSPLAPAGAQIAVVSPDGRWRLVARQQEQGAATELQEIAQAGRVAIRLPYATELAFDATSRWYLAVGQGGIEVGAVPAAAGGQPEVHHLPITWCTPTRGWSMSSTRYGFSMLDLRLLPGGRGLLAGRGDGLALVDVASGAEVARLRSWPDGSWLITTPDGRYAGSPGVGSRLTLIGPDGRTAAAEQLAARHQPEELRRRLAAYVDDAQATERLAPSPAPASAVGDSSGF